MICLYIKKVVFSDTIIEIFSCRVFFRVCFSSMEWLELHSEKYLYFLLHGKEFRVVFSSAEWFGMKFREFASILVPWNGIPSCYLFRGRVRNGIPRFSVLRNNRNSVRNNNLFRLFRLPGNYFFVGNSQP
jgi:hypothetical protein